MMLMSSFVIFHESVGTVKGGPQVFGVAGQSLEAEIAVSILAYSMRLDVVIPELAPAVVTFRAGIRGCVRHLRPKIVFGSKSVFQFVIDQALQECNGPRIPGVGIKTFNKALHHGSQIPSRVRPWRVGSKVEGGSVRTE